MKKHNLLAATAAGVFATSALFGQAILFQDDFSTSEANGDPSQAIWGTAGVRNATADKTIKVTTANSLQYFGEENNGYLHLRKEGASGSLFITANNLLTTPSTVITVSFDFYKPSITSWGDANPNGLGPRIRMGINDPVASNANRVANDNRFDQNGTFAGVPDVFSPNTAHSIQIVYNHSSSVANYATNPSINVPSETYDVWIDGVRVLAGHTYNTFASGVAVDTALSSIGIAGFNNETAEFFMDNLVVYSGAIPEPSTYALIGGLVVLGAAVVLRRRRR